MDRQILLRKLAALQQELQTAEMDDDTRQRLLELRADIDRVLDENQEDPDGETFAERLKDAVYQFEASHPDLAKSISTVLNMLSSMGI